MPKNITQDTIIVNYDEVTLQIDYELYETEKNKRIVYNATPIGLADQAVLNAIEEHLKMKKNVADHLEKHSRTFDRRIVFEFGEGGKSL